jgi:hypothetical protein
MYGTRTWQGMAARDNAAALRGSEATLNEQLARDCSGKLRDEVLDELAVAAQDIEASLEAGPDEANERVLRDLLAALRLGESIVAQVWQSVHGT